LFQLAVGSERNRNPALCRHRTDWRANGKVGLLRAARGELVHEADEVGDVEGGRGGGGVAVGVGVDAAYLFMKQMKSATLRMGEVVEASQLG
jgi:hypothetical protein